MVPGRAGRYPGSVVRPHDTSVTAYEAQIAVYRRMTPEQRVALAASMSEDAREIAREGIRARHPDYTPRDVEMALRRLLLGDDLVRRAWPDEPIRLP